MMHQDETIETTWMELLPISAPVYGGGLIAAFFPEDYNFPDELRAFLVFQGSKQRQVTEAKVSLEDNAFHAVIPDHEPPEKVEVSAYVQLHGSTIQCIASEKFTYCLDQTCYLAKYLADSVHNLESLEDWDNIRGKNFSLEEEDFSSLDERLTSAFQHLILPSDWNLLGDSATENMPRETLFHFASRLGLSTFVTLLLEKNGANSCLKLRNKHNQLAKDVAEERGFDGLADLIKDPHAHGVIKWETKEYVGRTIVLTRHSFGTLSTTVEIDNEKWPHLKEEINALCQSSAPPATPIPYQLGNDTVLTSEDSIFLSPVQNLHEGSGSELPANQMFPFSYDIGYDYHSADKNDQDDLKLFLDDSIQQVRKISDGIHYFDFRDNEMLYEKDANDQRLFSTSCPDLPQSVDNGNINEYSNTSTTPRNRRGLPLDKEEELEQQLLADDAPLIEISSPVTLERRHSWHSSEDLARDEDMNHQARKSVSDGEDEMESTNKNVIVSPTVVRRGAHKNMAMFGIVSTANETENVPEINSRSVSMYVATTSGNQEMEPDRRRHTVNEGVFPNESTSDITQQNDSFKPPVPPRTLKKMNTRKISFLEKMRSSGRNKLKEKGKIRSFAEMRFGIKKEGSRDSLHITGTNGEECKRASIIDRPKSMMINHPNQYSVGPPRASHLPPSSSSRSRPVSTLDAFQTSSSSIESLQQPSHNRSSFHEEEDGVLSKFSQSTKNQISGSCESLSESRVDIADLESDPDLKIKPEEPDSWNATIDKKTLKKLSLSKKDTKRQENIFEFILTERNHLTTLKILQLIYARCLHIEYKMEPTIIDKLFPQIDSHVEFVSQFVKELTARQHNHKVVSGIGDIMVSQWEGTNGETMKRLFGDFCSKQNEITNQYKELIKTDKKFQALMKKCDSNRLARRQDIPGCALLITQRITKYPIMVQTMLENTNRKEHKEDYQNLERALELSREIAKDVDEQVQTREREILLMETYDKIDSKSSTTFKDLNRKFDRKDFLKTNRKLLYSTNLQWKENKKFMDVFFLLLSDCIVLLQDNNGKYVFPSGQPAAIPLQKMIVREVANNEKALYLMSMRTQQMYTLMVTSADHCKTLTNTIRLAIGKCPDEDEGITSEDEGERRIHDHRLDKAKQLLNQLMLTDQRINRMLEEKISFFKALAENAGRAGAIANLHFSFVDHFVPADELDSSTSFPAGAPLLGKAIELVNKLTETIYGPAGLTRHLSTAEEHQVILRPSTSLPKRSDTFGGFDNGKEPSSPRANYLNSSQSDSKLSDGYDSKAPLFSSNRDSGFHSELAMGQASSSRASVNKSSTPNLDSSGDSAPGHDPEINRRSYIPPTSEQVGALTSLAKILSEYQSFASQQDTHVERLQALLIASKKKTVGGGLQEAELKRNQIKQQEQMDELRKQQHQFRIEKERWQIQIDRFERSLENDKAEIAKEKINLRIEREEHEKEKFEVQQAKERYQHELTRLRSLQRQAHPPDLQLPGSTSSISPTNKNNSNNVDSGFSISSSKSHSNLQASTVEIRATKPSSSATYNVGDYPRTFPGPKRDSSSSQPQLPIHLQLSAANQSSNPQAVKHSDLSKISKLATSSKPSVASKQHSGGEKSGIHQFIPHKLSKQPYSTSGKKHHIV